MGERANQEQVKGWLSGTESRKQDYSANSPRGMLCPPILGVEEADNCRIQSEFGICGAGKELTGLWKSSSSCGWTMGRGCRCGQKGADGLGGNQGVKIPEVFMRPKGKCSESEEVRKPGG